MSLRTSFAETMLQVAQDDDKLVVFVGDISHGIFSEFRERFSNRYYNIGICEPAMVNVAAGLSAKGLYPVVHTIAPFLIERSYEQIKLDFSYQELSLNLVSVGGAFDYSKLGCSHHCYSDYSLMAQFKNSKIFFPGSPVEFKTLFEKEYNNGKVNYFRLTEFPHEVEFKSDEIIPGKAIRINEGTDITLLTTGSLLAKVQMAAKELSDLGISAEILYFHTLKPLDQESIRISLNKTRKFITFEEISSHDGLFNQVNSAIAGSFSYLSHQIAIADFIRAYGTYEELSESVGLTVENLVSHAVLLMGTNLN